ncbi:PGG domain-containing protein [Plasmodiophora brassicae]|uniref:PGG domain-containing protein n=1 Tax=Plasmodiophora brassicae TaxID=37360 RepID=A0A0G4IP64_PLABS|nr:hypothetical protein PBRA_005563 [Plasmodiophora brassicae]
MLTGRHVAVLVLVVAAAVVRVDGAASERQDFFDAVCNGDLRAVQRHNRSCLVWTAGEFCTSGPNITGLHLAAVYGYDHIVSWLIHSGADVNAVDGNGNTPLHLACVSEKQAVVVEIVASGRADLFARNRFQQTPLGIAMTAYVGLHLSPERCDNVLGIVMVLLDAGATYGENWDIARLKMARRKRLLGFLRTKAKPRTLFNAIKDADEDSVRGICDGNVRWVQWTDPTGRDPPFQAALAALWKASSAVSIRNSSERDLGINRYQRLLSICRYFALHPNTDVTIPVYNVDDGFLGLVWMPSVHVAAVSGDRALLATIIDREPRLINSQCTGMTVIDWCSLRLARDPNEWMRQHLRANRDLLIEKGADIWGSELPLAFLLSSSINVTMLYLHQARNLNELVNTRFMVAADEEIVAIESNRDGWSPLLGAIVAGNDIIAMALIDAGADVTVSGSLTPDGIVQHVLHAAVEEGLSDRLICKLVSHPDIDIDKVDELGRTPLSIAVHEALSKSNAKPYLSIVNLLLENGASPCALGNDTPCNIKALFAEHRPACVREDPRPALLEGILACNLSAVHQICRKFPHWHAWHLDAGRSAFDIVFGNLLTTTSNGVDRQRLTDLAAYLIGACPYPDLRSLRVAVLYGTADLVNSIIAKNPYLLNRTDEHGMTPLSWCSLHLYWNRHDAQRAGPIRDALIQRWHADVDAISFIVAVDLGVTKSYLTRNNGTGIDAVITNADRDVRFPQVAPAGTRGNTALHMALLDRHLCNEEIAMFLVDRGADLTAVDGLGRTPLHLASRAGLHSVVQRILQKASETNVDVITCTDHSDMTPLLMALAYSRGDESSAKTIALLASPPEGRAQLRRIQDSISPQNTKGLRLHRALDVISIVAESSIALAIAHRLVHRFRQTRPAHTTLSTGFEKAVIAATVASFTFVLARKSARARVYLEQSATGASLAATVPKSGAHRAMFGVCVGVSVFLASLFMP